MTNELLNPPVPKRRGRTWTPEQRARQSALLRRLKPWTRSSGPRTAAGKEKSRMNALRHGFRSAQMKEFNAILRVHRRFLGRIRASIAAAGRGHGGFSPLQTPDFPCIPAPNPLNVPPLKGCGRLPGVKTMPRAAPHTSFLTDKPQGASPRRKSGPMLKRG